MKLAESFGYPHGLIKPVLTGELKQIAERPKNSCLRVEKAEKMLGMRFVTAERGIEEMKNQSLPVGPD